MHLVETSRDDQALDWVRVIQDPDFTDWSAHLAWLEADRRNSEAFDRMALLIERASAGLGPPLVEPAADTAANDDPADTARARRWPGLWLVGGGAIAASVAALIAIAPVWRHDARPYLLRTGAGETRAVTLADGTRIALNGGTTVALDRGDPRSATLENGEAFVAVVHDPARPFRLHVGDTIVQDVGTAFDVARSPGATEVAVREGAVVYDPQGAAVSLRQGQAVRIANNVAAVRVVDAASVGGWRDGRLAFRDATLSDVAESIGRSIGARVAIDPQLAGRRFSGVVRIENDRARMFRRFAAVADVSVARDGAGWRMAPVAR